MFESQRIMCLYQLILYVSKDTRYDNYSTKHGIHIEVTLKIIWCTLLWIENTSTITEFTHSNLVS